jgi:vacuolar-type H+-ATPase subunit I/STV1
MKKVTIITFPEYESLVLGSLGEAGVTQFVDVAGADYDEYRKEVKGPDYKALYDEIAPRYKELKKLINFEIQVMTPLLDVLRDYTRNPEIRTKQAVQHLDRVIGKLKDVKEAQANESERLTKEYEEKISKGSALFHEKKRSLVEQKSRWDTKIELIKALGTEDLKNSLGYGIVNTDFLKRLEQHLAQHPEEKVKANSINASESFVMVSGPEDARKTVLDHFLVFEVYDISVVLGEDAKAIIDPYNRGKMLEKYQGEMDAWIKGIQATGATFDEKIAAMDAEHQSAVKLIEEEKDEKLKVSTEAVKQRYANVEEDVKQNEMAALSEATFCYNTLRLGSDIRAPVMRTKVFSILQGWTPAENIGEFNEAIKKVEEKIGEKIVYDVDDVEPGDMKVPTPPPTMHPSFLQSNWKLTTLRGYPSSNEFNPAYLSIIIFAFQFGLMYGDVGQGAVILILGIVLSRKFTKGMLKYLGGLFIPMGISAIIFGFLYGSIFLNETILEEFYHPIMPNPIHQTTTLLKLVFFIAAAEVVLGLLIGAWNQIRKGNPVGALGEHGLGMILYVVGLYFTAMYFISIGMNFMGALNFWGFYMMIAGMLLSFAEPVIHSIQHGHGVGMESIGEGIGGLLMTFVEGLANLFSFLRIAAFALAHTSLAVAAEALNEAIVLPVPLPIGLIIMNVVAMSFELISSTVQSLRLLYYEFMGKFFDGSGVPFKPFTVPKERKTTQ